MPLYDARIGSHCRGTAHGWQIPGPVKIGAMIDVVINGTAERIAASASIASLLAARELVGKRVAIERNGEIVPKSLYADTVIMTGDRIEIVVAVGGG